MKQVRCFRNKREFFTYRVRTKNKSKRSLAVQKNHSQKNIPNREFSIKIPKVSLKNLSIDSLTSRKKKLSEIRQMAEIINYQQIQSTTTNVIEALSREVEATIDPKTLEFQSLFDAMKYSKKEEVTLETQDLNDFFGVDYVNLRTYSDKLLNG